MKKMSRRERKIYKLGKQAGYLDGYSKGLHDGNPFVLIVESVQSICASITTPEFIEQIKKLQEEGKLTGDVYSEDDE